MVTYAIPLFAFALLFLFFGVSAQKGNTKLPDDDHLARMEASDQKDSRKSLAKGMFLISFALGFDGMIALFAGVRTFARASCAIFFIGFIVSIVTLVKGRK